MNYSLYIFVPSTLSIFNVKELYKLNGFIVIFEGSFLFCLLCSLLICPVLKIITTSEARKFCNTFELMVTIRAAWCNGTGSTFFHVAIFSSSFLRTSLMPKLKTGISHAFAIRMA